MITGPNPHALLAESGYHGNQCAINTEPGMSEADVGVSPVPTSPRPRSIVVERTLAIIKPDAIDRADEIIEDMVANGFTILQVRVGCVHHTGDQEFRT